MKVLCIGHTSWDISCPVDNYPTENTKYRMTEKVSCGGGPASNAAYLLGKWGVDTSIATVVGDDTFGDKIKKEFRSVNIKDDFIETAFDKDTSLSFILINKTNGSRTIFNVATETIPLKKYVYDFTPDIIFTDGHDYGATQNALNCYPKAIKIIDAGRVTPELLELCKYMNYIVCSKVFAETVSGIKIDYNNSTTLVNLYNALRNKFPNSTIVVTLEDMGALYMINNEIKIMPGLKFKAVDTTGAGDIFHGAFTYCISNNYDLETSVTISNITAGLSITKMGGRLSIPALSDVLDYYQGHMQGIRNVNNQIQMQNMAGANNQNQMQNLVGVNNQSQMQNMAGVNNQNQMQNMAGVNNQNGNNK